MMATAEKALCDQLYKISPVANYKELERLLFEDLRIDMSAIAELSKKDIDLYAQNYGSTNVKKLAGYMRKMR